MVDEVHKVIVGQDDTVRHLLCAMLAKGHCLVIGVPGLAKALIDGMGHKRLTVRVASYRLVKKLLGTRAQAGPTDDPWAGSGIRKGQVDAWRKWHARTSKDEGARCRSEVEANVVPRV